MQGRQMRDQEQLQQQEISGDKLKNAMSVFQMLGQIGQSDRQALDSPEMQAFVKRYVGGSGVPLPTNPQGGIDVNAFLQPASTLLNNKTFLSEKPNSPVRQQFINSVGGTPEEKQQYLNLPQTLDTSAGNAALRSYTAYLTQIGNGADPRSLVPLINTAAAESGQPMAEMRADGKVYLQGSDTPLTMTAKTGAQVGNLQSGTTKNQAQTGYLNSLSQFTQTKNAWYGKLSQATVDHLKASSGLDEAEMAAIPQKLAIGWMNAHTARNKADYEFERLQMAQSDFKALGDHSPQAIAAYNGLLTGYQKQAALDQQALNAVRTQIKGILSATIGEDPAANTAAGKLLATYRAQETNLNKRYNSDLQIGEKLRGRRSQFTQYVQTNHIHKQGAPNDMRAIKTTTAPYGPVAHDPKTGKEYKWDAKRGAYVDASGAPYQP
jgi:hypothetical protein